MKQAYLVLTNADALLSNRGNTGTCSARAFDTVEQARAYADRKCATSETGRTYLVVHAEHLFAKRAVITEQVVARALAG